MKALIRAAQTYFPGLLETKCWLQRRGRLLLRRPSDPDFSALRVLAPPAPGQVHLDIGANRGQCIDAIRMLRPKALIHAFEPNPLMVERLNKMFKGAEQVTLHRFGLDDRSGSFSLHVPFYRGFMFDGLASFDPGEAADWLRRHLPGFQERHQEVRQVNCEVRPLDGLGLDPCFIKIDVQGLEPRVIRGGIETIKKSRPALLIETPNAEINDLLSGLGYRRGRWNGRDIELDRDGDRNSLFLSERNLDLRMRPG